MRAELPTGTVTFLFTDIEGSTRLLHALGPDEYANVLAAHRRALRDAFAEHGGVEVDTQGDAFFVAFPTALAAAQAALMGIDALDPGPVRVRMGAGWEWWLAGQLSNLAFLALDRDDLAEAERDGREGLRIVRDQENRQWALWLMSALARAALARGETGRAGIVWGAVRAETERVPSGSWQARQAEQASDLLAATGSRFLAAVEQGRQLDLWDAAAIALGEDEAAQTVP